MNVLSVILFSFSISIDAFSLAIGYGVQGIKFSLLSSVLINLINGTFLCVSAFFSQRIFACFSADIIVYIGSSFLFFMGVLKFAEFFKNRNKERHFVVRDFGFGDWHKNYFCFEIKKGFSIIPLMCIESVISGFGFLSYGANMIFYLICFAIFFHSLFLFLGSNLGNKMTVGYVEIDFSWFSGIIFIFLSMMKIFG